MDSLRCPITQTLFRDPVIGTDNQTYERKAITEWLQKHGTSPLTRQPMDVQRLQTNDIVTKIINELQTIPKFPFTQYRYKLGVDIRKKPIKPLFKAFDKVIYDVEWISREGPPIILVKIKGAAAICEASFYMQLSCHPHIVRTFGLVESNPDSVMLLQEYAPMGDFSELLREHAFRPSEGVLVEIFLQLSDAMICLADNDIVHGDLACRNVLVFRSYALEPKENLVKLTDFGLARTTPIHSVADNIASSTITTLPVRYAAPEILRTKNGANYSEKSDVYSMGVLMWEACSFGALPYSSVESDDEVRHRKLNKEQLPQPPCSSHLWNIMKECWSRHPRDRPDFRSLRQSLLMLQFKTTSNTRQESIDDGRSNFFNSTIISVDNRTTMAVRNSNEQDRRQMRFGLDQRSIRDHVSSCSFCKENFPSEETMRTHLLICGNKTEQCSTCHQFVRRAIFIYHSDNNCTNPEESDILVSKKIGSLNRHPLSQFNQPKPEVYMPTHGLHSNINDDSAFTNRRNMVHFASMGSTTKSSRQTIECEFCHGQYERTEYTRHQENCFRNPTNVDNSWQQETSQSMIRSDLNRRQKTSSTGPGVDRSNSTNQRHCDLSTADPSCRRTLYDIQEWGHPFK